MGPMLSLATILTLALSTQADTVTFKDGKIYEGTFMGTSADHVTFQIDTHTECHFAVGEIKSIRFQRSKTISLIDQKYNAMKGRDDAGLGTPIGEEQAAADGRGRYRLYQNGTIYYTPQTGAHAVQGPIGDRWLGMGAERSELGYPTGDEMIWPDGRRSMNFEHGTIIWDQHDVPMVEIRAH
jgi:uncharacterized protein with LGFP repeats